MSATDPVTSALAVVDAPLGELALLHALALALAMACTAVSSLVDRQLLEVSTPSLSVVTGAGCSDCSE